MLKRRGFLGGAVLGLIAGDALAAGAVRGTAGALYIGCRKLGARHEVAGFDADGHERFALALPDRGHSIALHPHRPWGVAFARRPGRFAVVFDHAEAVALRRIDAAPGRHFYGHGVFSPDGRWLFATQNDWASGFGRIAVLDAETGFALSGELSSNGIGPHDLRLLPDGQTLVVANGGIRTHPDRAREKLNLDTMRPSLSLVDVASGRSIDDLALPPELHRLSIRHLSVAPDGRVAFAMQHEGRKSDLVPLVGVLEPEGLRCLEGSIALSRRLRHYIGSLAFDRSGKVIAASAPRANAVTLWDAESGELLAEHRIADGCGVAAADTPQSFIVTGSAGGRYRIAADGGSTPLDPEPPADWDNHLVG